MPGQRYSFAPEVEKIGRELVAADHRHLLQMRVEYCFAEKTPRNKGGEIWGTARVVSGLAAYLAGEKGEEDDPGQFFVITISRPVWDLLSDHARRALIDHELRHCWVEETERGEMKLSLLSHDLEEFSATVLKYGVWRDSIKRFMKNAEEGISQANLLEMEPESSGDREASRADEILTCVGLDV